MNFDTVCFHPSFTIPVEECQALAALYSGTDGQNWTNNTNWFVTADVETWYGVSVGVYSGGDHVDGIFLHRSSGGDSHGLPVSWNGNNLDGPITPLLTDLRYLIDFNITNNDIT